MRVLVDTNVLLRLKDADCAEHPVCANAVQVLPTRGDELVVGPQSLIEYWTVLTRPLENNGFGRSPAEAATDIADLRLTFTLLEEPTGIFSLWLDLVTRYQVRGKPTHDARLVALMLGTGVTQLLTLNGSDFKRYSEITCLAPGDV